MTSFIIHVLAGFGSIVLLILTITGLVAAWEEFKQAVINKSYGTITGNEIERLKKLLSEEYNKSSKYSTQLKIARQELAELKRLLPPSYRESADETPKDRVSA